MIQILPGVLATTKAEFDAMIKKVSPFVSMVHVDVADGIFTKTKFVGPEVVAPATAGLSVELHLMIKNPETVLNEWLSMPQVKRVTLHIEATDKIQEIIDTIHKAGKEAGLSLNPETPAEAVEPFIDKIDLVQFMSVQPGKYGAEYLPEVLEKVVAFHAAHPNVLIEIDGGVSPERMPEMVKAGASVFVSGGYIMNSEDPGKAIAELNKAAQ